MEQHAGQIVTVVSWFTRVTSRTDRGCCVLVCCLVTLVMTRNCIPWFFQRDHSIEAELLWQIMRLSCGDRGSGDGCIVHWALSIERCAFACSIEHKALVICVGFYCAYSCWKICYMLWDLNRENMLSEFLRMYICFIVFFTGYGAHPLHCRESFGVGSWWEDQNQAYRIRSCLEKIRIS